MEKDNKSRIKKRCVSHRAGLRGSGLCRFDPETCTTDPQQSFRVPNIQTGEQSVLSYSVVAVVGICEEPFGRGLANAI